MMSSEKWIPEIMYEENSDGTSSSIPFVAVPVDENMPKILYVFESRESDETEPNNEGDEVPVFQWDLHQYADMNYLKTVMSDIEYDNLRFCLGLEPLNEAVKKGIRITDDVRQTIEVSTSSK
tara:strand:+ start:1066 stop:1431 length:366 start_codon:yes stop_codon:yes gene_type:complete